jgi:hypothetical protein
LNTNNKIITNMDESKQCVILARKEFTSILIYYLYPSIYQGIRSIWEDAKKTALPRDVYQNFQNRLIRVRKWNQDVIDHEYKRIVNKTKCEWLNDLIKKVFVLNTQLLAATNVNSFRHKIKVKVPSAEKFIHVCYMECARSFFENALYMEDRQSAISKIEQSKNLQKSYKLIMQCIENAIRTLLPIESLVTEDYNTIQEGEDANPLPQMYKSLSPYNITNGNIEIHKIPPRYQPPLEEPRNQQYEDNQVPFPRESNSNLDLGLDILGLPSLENFEFPESNNTVADPEPNAVTELPPQTALNDVFLNNNNITFDSQIQPQETIEKPQENIETDQFLPRFDPLPSLDIYNIRKEIENKEKELNNRNEGDASDNNSVAGDINMPIIKRSRQEMDLDVDSINDVKQSKVERKLPAIDDFDSKSFFSDAED